MQWGTLGTLPPYSLHVNVSTWTDPFRPLWTAVHFRSRKQYCYFPKLLLFPIYQEFSTGITWCKPIGLLGWDNLLWCDSVSVHCVLYLEAFSHSWINKAHLYTGRGREQVLMKILDFLPPTPCLLPWIVFTSNINWHIGPLIALWEKWKLILQRIWRQVHLFVFCWQYASSVP